MFPVDTGVPTLGQQLPGRNVHWLVSRSLWWIPGALVSSVLTLCSLRKGHFIVWARSVDRLPGLNSLYKLAVDTSAQGLSFLVCDLEVHN